MNAKKAFGLFAAFLFLFGLSRACLLYSQTEPVPGPESTPLNVQESRYLKWPVPEDEKKTETLTIFVSTSQVLRFDRALSRVAVSNTNICDITTLGPQEILLYCPKAGKVDLIVWDSSFQIATYYVQSVVDYKKLEEILSHIDPESEIKVVPYEDTVAIYGTAKTAEKMKQIADAAKAFNAKALSYVKVLKQKQIMLEVRFAEIDRKATRNYGLDGESISRFIVARSFTGGAHSGTVVDADSGFTPRDAAMAVQQLTAPDPAKANGFFGYTSTRLKVQTNLEWLISKNILKLIARPNLVTLDGEQASFVVGGESPFITSTQTSVNVAFKEFGTKLSFLPNVIDEGKIRLKMQVEVSDLDFSSTVSLQGTTVPTIVKATHVTVAELKDEQTLVVGGLINQRINRVEKKFPVLGDIPLLDRLFKKLEFTRKDIELLIVVTPHIVEPFENTKKKEFYPPDEVAKVSSVYVPAYPDDHADRVNRLLVQDENYNDFDGFPFKRAKEIDKQFETIKSKEKSEKKRKEIIQKKVEKTASFDPKTFPPVAPA